jgi:hypothetical protein
MATTSGAIKGVPAAAKFDIRAPNRNDFENIDRLEAP